MTKFRKDLINGKRDKSPCSLCNAEGTVLGKTMQMNGQKYIQILQYENNNDHRCW